MRFLLSTLLAASLASFQFACSSAKKETEQRNPPVQTPSEKYRLKAEEKLKDHVEYLMNPSKTFILCLKRSKPDNILPQQRVEFFVYDLRADTVVYEDVLANGSVAWNNDDQIQVNIVPGIVTNDEKTNQRITSYLYDLKLKKTLQKGAEELRVRE